MRLKQQILDDTTKIDKHALNWDRTASLHEQLIIEVLIDIRDHLFTITKTLQDMDSYHVTNTD